MLQQALIALEEENADLAKGTMVMAEQIEHTFSHIFPDLLALGEKRAQNTLNFLVTLGIDSSRMSTVSYGEERPLAAGTTEEARMKNRRAHFVIER